MVERSESVDQGREVAPAAAATGDSAAAALSDSTRAWLDEGRTERPVTADVVAASRAGDNVSSRLSERGDARPTVDEVRDAAMALVDVGRVEQADQLAANAVFLGYPPELGVDAKLADAMSEAGNDAGALTLAEGWGFSPESSRWSDDTSAEVRAAFGPFVDRFSAGLN